MPYAGDHEIAAVARKASEGGDVVPMMNRPGGSEAQDVGQGGGIGINASIVGESPTGLGLHAINLIRSLDAIRDDLRVYTSCPDAFGGVRAHVLPASSLARPERGLRGHFSRRIWGSKTALRVRARSARMSALLNTVPEAILGSRVPQITVVHDLLPLFFPAEYPRQQYDSPLPGAARAQELGGSSWRTRAARAATSSRATASPPRRCA